MQNLLNNLKLSDECKVLTDEPLKNHTTFRIGGNASVIIFLSTTQDIRRAVIFCQKNNLPYFVMGNGSNLLVADKGFDGVVLKLSGTKDNVVISGREVVCGAGVLISSLYSAVCCEGLSGLEYFAGIPATAGGAVSMNMGSFEKSFSGLVKEVYVIDKNGAEKTLQKDEITFGYRYSSLSTNEFIVTGMKLVLEFAGQAEIRAKYSECLNKKLLSQPLDMPSAGCVFKNPSGESAGYLIEQSGLKGCRIGGALVSKKHANYIVNDGAATAADVIALMEIINNKVMLHSGIQLDTEIKLLGF